MTERESKHPNSLNVSQEKPKQTNLSARKENPQLVGHLYNAEGTRDIC